MAVLISKDSNGKIRIADISYEWNDEQHGYIIKRATGCLNGKITQQPDIIILRGKAKRTVSEQALLEYNSNKKKYLDKGYKELKKPLNEYSLEDLENILGEIRTGQNNIPKPQLAKQADKITNLKTFDKSYYGSRKIDGLRVLIYMGEDNQLHTASRGAITYDAAMCEILTHPKLLKLFKNNPGLIMDGECYKHGLSLQEINSIARKQVTATDYSILQFYWYDIVDTTLTTEERINKINQLASDLNLTFEPEKQFQSDELRIQLVPHEEVSGWDNILKLHNDYVSEGWEGLVIRLKTSTYGPGKRCNDWIKIKAYLDGTYKVVDYELGLRGSEDMVFILETAEGKTFKASPMGTKADKEEYIRNFEKRYKNKLGDCKYFNISAYGIPQQPKFISFRWDLE